MMMMMALVAMRKYNNNKKNLLLTFFILLFSCCGLVYTETFSVAIQTLTTGTDGTIRIQFTGILGKSDYIDVETPNYFFRHNQLYPAVSVKSVQNIDSLLEISLAVFDGQAAHIGTVTVIEPTSSRSVVYNFGKSIAPGRIVSEISPSPDLGKAQVMKGPNNVSIVSSIILEDGARLHLITSVEQNGTNNGKPSYRWFKDNKANSPIPLEVGDKKQSLIFKSLKSPDTAKYFCVVALGDSVVKTADINVVVNYLWIQPLQVTITGSSFIQEGSDVLFTCSGSSNLPGVVASWQKGQSVLKTEKVSLNYIFKSITKNDTGRYICKVEVGGKSRNSTMDINVIFLEEPRLVAPNNIINSTVHILPNQTAELTCKSDGNPSTLTYKIFENGKKIETHGVSKNQFLVKKGGGNYSCVATNGYLEKTVSFKVDAPAFTASLTTSQPPISNDFWTKEMIVIVAMACGFFFIILFMMMCIVCLCLKAKKRTSSERHSTIQKPRIEVNSETPKDIFFRTTDYQNNYIDDTLTRDISVHKDKNHPKTTSSQFSLSSEEYKSSNNEISLTPSQNETKVIANGKGKADTEQFDLALIEATEKHHQQQQEQEQEQQPPRDKKKNRAHRTQLHKNHRAEEGEGSSNNWKDANDSKAILPYNNVEYC